MQLTDSLAPVMIMLITISVYERYTLFSALEIGAAKRKLGLNVKC